MELAKEDLQGKRVIFSRNGYDGNGIVVGKEEDNLVIAVNVAITSLQTYAYFKENEVEIKMM